MRDADAAGPRPPRAVPDAPVGPFAAGTGLAKAWLLALLARAPLEEAGALPVARMAREAPALCAAVVRAVAADDALRRLGPGGADAGLARDAGALAGAADAAGAIAALDVLRDVVSRALRAEDSAADPAAVADRVAHVCAVLAVASSSAAAGAAPSPDVVVLDTRRRAETWRTVLDDALAGADGPVAVLCAELDDLDRLLLSHPTAELAVVVDAVTAAMAAALPDRGILGVDGPGRWTAVVPDEGPAGARTVAERCVAAAARAGELRGLPVAVRIGVAVGPDDGRLADDLAEVAQRRRIAAEAAGVPVTD